MLVFKKSHIRKIKFLIVRLFDKFFLKREDRVLLIIKKNTSFSSNHRVACEFLIQNTSKLNIAILVEDGLPKKIKKELLTYQVQIFETSSISYFYFLWTCKTLLISHSVRDAYIDQPHKGRTIVNYWHGASYKKIELLMHNIDKVKAQLIEHNSSLYDYMISSGKNDQKIISQSFKIDSSRILPIGLPRYDLLKNYNSIFSYDQLESFFQEAAIRDKQIIMYAPTFREEIPSPLSHLTKKVLTRLNEHVAKYDATLLIRPHSYDKFQLNVDSYENIIYASHENFVETNILLNHIDILIVDYSSIWIDYLIKDQPIIFYQPDSIHYNDNERGVNYSNENLPGPVVSTVDALTHSLIDTIRHDAYKDQRLHFRSIFHDYAEPETTFTAELFASIPELKTLVNNH